MDIGQGGVENCCHVSKMSFFVLVTLNQITVCFQLLTSFCPICSHIFKTLNTIITSSICCNHCSRCVFTAVSVHLDGLNAEDKLRVWVTILGHTPLPFPFPLHTINTICVVFTQYAVNYHVSKMLTFFFIQAYPKPKSWIFLVIFTNA